MKSSNHILKLASKPVSIYTLIMRLRQAMRSDLSQVGLRGSTAELVARQISETGFRRLDLVIAYLALKAAHCHSAKSKTCGLTLLEKFLNVLPNWNAPGRALLNLLKRGPLNEGLYLPENLFVNGSLDIPHDSSPLAVAIYRNEPTVNLSLVAQESCPCYDSLWLKQHGFSVTEIEYIHSGQLEIFSKLNLLEIPWESRCRIQNQLSRFLPKNSTLHGRGGFYQSCHELLINGQRPTELRFQRYQLHSYLKATDRVLEIGCNCGFFSLHVSNYVASIEGFDIDPSFIAIANSAKAFLKKENCHFIRSSFQDFSVKNRFDVVFSFAVHHWIGLPISVYATKLRGLLKPNGIILLESQDLNTHDADWEHKLSEFCKMGFEIIERGNICDDGQLVREFLYLRDKEVSRN